MIGGKKSKDFLTHENDMDLRFQRPDGAVLAHDPAHSLLWSVGLLICALRKVQSPNSLLSFMQRLADPALGGKEVRESSFDFLRIDDLFHGLKVTSQRRIEGEGDDSFGTPSRRSQLLAEMTLSPFLSSSWLWSRGA